jgi:hypothetical protein
MPNMNNYKQIFDKIATELCDRGWDHKYPQVWKKRIDTRKFMITMCIVSGELRCTVFQVVSRDKCVMLYRAVANSHDNYIMARNGIENICGPFVFHPGNDQDWMDEFLKFVQNGL